MCLEKAQPYTWLHQQELLRLASNKNNLWNAVEKMVERCWNFPKILWSAMKKFYRILSKCRVYTIFVFENHSRFTMTLKSTLC